MQNARAARWLAAFTRGLEPTERKTKRTACGSPLRRRIRMFADASGRVEPPSCVDRGRPVSVKARLISSRETARLMGLPDDYALPENYNEAYHLTGDGVVVPVVRHLAEHIFEPVLEATQAQKTSAA